jgi:hypothetical protein
MTLPSEAQYEFAFFDDDDEHRGEVSFRRAPNDWRQIFVASFRFITRKRQLRLA